MGFASEFKAFAMRGNVIDMAVGIVIGGAFGKIVSSFVADVMMPPIGMVTGGVDFKDVAITLKEATVVDGNEVAAITMNVGKFANTLIDFVIIAFAIFMVIKAMNSAKKNEEAKPAAPPAPSKEEVLLGEIRDLLKKG
jgi:large conductance mechanosensitive channel